MKYDQKNLFFSLHLVATGRQTGRNMIRLYCDRSPSSYRKASAADPMLFSKLIAATEETLLIFYSHTIVQINCAQFHREIRNQTTTHIAHFSPQLFHSASFSTHLYIREFVLQHADHNSCIYCVTDVYPISVSLDLSQSG